MNLCMQSMIGPQMHCVHMQSPMGLHMHSGMGCHMQSGKGCHMQSGMGCHMQCGMGCHIHSGTGCHMHSPIMRPTYVCDFFQPSNIPRKKPPIINMCIAWLLSDMHSPICYFFPTKKKKPPIINTCVAWVLSASNLYKQYANILFLIH